jgi:hypothetical protein
MLYYSPFFVICQARKGKRGNFIYNLYVL